MIDPHVKTEIGRARCIQGWDNRAVGHIMPRVAEGGKLQGADATRCARCPGVLARQTEGGRTEDGRVRTGTAVRESGVPVGHQLLDPGIA